MPAPEKRPHVALGMLTTKLEALRAAAAAKIGDPRSRYLDPLNTLDLWERYEPLRDALREQFPEVLGDLPVRPRPVSSGTTDHDGRGYITRSNFEQLIQDITYCLALLGGFTSETDVGIRATREGVFLPGSRFDAMVLVNELIDGATTEIFLIDGYVDENVLSLVSAKKDGVDVRVLTRKLSPALETVAAAFNHQYGGLAIRTSEDFHDRFLILDRSDYFHFGASLKDAGKRGFMFSRIEEPSVIKTLADGAEQAWDNATPVVKP